MKIASTLLTWLQKTTSQQTGAPASGASDAPPLQNQSPSPVAKTGDSVQFSDLAKKLSDSRKHHPEAEITFEERQALHREFEPATYKPPLMQLAKKLLGIKIF